MRPVINTLTQLAQENPKVDSVDLSNSGITDLGLIGPHLRNLRNLKELNLEDNPLT